MSIVHELCIDMTEHREGAQDPGEKEQDLNIFPPKLGFLPDNLCNGSTAMTNTKWPTILSSPRALLVREVQFLALAKVEATFLMI